MYLFHYLTGRTLREGWFLFYFDLFCSVLFCIQSIVVGPYRYSDLISCNQAGLRLFWKSGEKWEEHGKLGLVGIERGGYILYVGRSWGIFWSSCVDNLSTVNSLNRDKGHERKTELLNLEMRWWIRLFCSCCSRTFHLVVFTAHENTGVNLALLLSWTFEARGLIEIVEGKKWSKN